MKGLVLALILSSTTTSVAGSFRGGTLNWQIADPAAPHDVTFRVTTYWDEPATDSANVAIDFGDGTTSGALPSAVVYTSSTAARGEAFTIREGTTTHTYAVDGSYTAAISGCCRHATKNALASDPYRVPATVSLGTGSFGNPVMAAVDVEVASGPGANDTVLPIIAAGWWGGSGIGGHIASLAESGLQPVPNASLNPIYARVFWQPTGTEPGDSYTLSIVLDDVGGTSATLELVVETTPPFGALEPYCLFVDVPAIGAEPGRINSAVEQGFWLTTQGTLDANVLALPATGATLLDTSTLSTQQATLTWAPPAGTLGRYDVAVLRILDATNHQSRSCGLGLYAPRPTTKCALLPSVCHGDAGCHDTDFGIACECDPGSSPLSPVECAVPSGGGCVVTMYRCGFDHSVPVYEVCCDGVCSCPIDNGGSGLGAGLPATTGGGCAADRGSSTVLLLVGLVALGLRRRR